MNKPMSEEQRTVLDYALVAHLADDTASPMNYVDIPWKLGNDVIKHIRVNKPVEKKLFEGISISEKQTASESRLRLDIDKYIRGRLHNIPTLTGDIKFFVQKRAAE